MNLYMLFAICFIGAITPGPDILIVVRNCLKFGFFAGFKCLCGIATGWVILFVIVYFGLASFAQKDIFQCIIGLIGGCYLAYISYKLIKSTKCEINIDDTNMQSDTYLRALIVNISNPKAILFFAVILSPFIKDNLWLGVLVSFCSLFSGFLLVIFMCCFFRKFVTPNIFMIMDRICAALFFAFALLLLYQSYSTLMHYMQSAI